MKAILKRALLPQGPRPRTILSGPLRGLRMEFDLAHDTQRWLGLHEREIHPWLRAFSTGIQSGVDVGASDGAYALFLSQKARARTVLAFEPAPEMAARAERNAGFARPPAAIEIHRSAVGNAGPVSLDAFEARLAEPTLVKIDVDGGEEDVLEGAKQLLGRARTRWIVETHSPALEQACVEAFRAAGLRTRVIDDLWWRRVLPELRPIPNRWLAAARADDPAASGLPFDP